MSETQAEITIKITQEGSAVRVSAHGSRGERPRSHILDPVFVRDRLDAFAAGVARAADAGRGLEAAVHSEACTLYDSLFQGAVRDVAMRLRESSAQNPLLVRLMISDPGLQAIPWEALCEPQTHAGFLGTSDRMLLARGVTSNEPGDVCRVYGTVRVLAIAPLPPAAAALRELESALAEPIAAGTAAWLPPITGEAASKSYLFERLRSASGPRGPHVIHFIGHGGVVGGRPMLRVADNDYGHEEWIPVDTLAQELGASFGGDLRLIVLEACQGAAPGAFGSAAETLAREGAQAVVAHLWPVRAPVARACSRELYRTLTGAERAKGDIVASLAAARRTLSLTSAEAFSPVVYLRSARSALFDFRGRTVLPPGQPSQPPRDARSVEVTSRSPVSNGHHVAASPSHASVRPPAAHGHERSGHATEGSSRRSWTPPAFQPTHDIGQQAAMPPNAGWTPPQPNSSHRHGQHAVPSSHDGWAAPQSNPSHRSGQSAAPSSHAAWTPAPSNPIHHGGQHVPMPSYPVATTTRVSGQVYAAAPSRQGGSSLGAAIVVGMILLLTGIGAVVALVVWALPDPVTDRRPPVQSPVQPREHASPAPLECYANRTWGEQCSGQTCQGGLGSLWNCDDQHRVRLRCEGGRVVVERCHSVCVTRPGGSDDVCR